MQRLLVIACGKRKRPDAELLPAIERYDGPPFRVLRRYLATSPMIPPLVFILSAKFGLIRSDQPIPYYDQRLTSQRAAELQPFVQDTLAQILTLREYEQIFLAVGRNYAQMLDGLPRLNPTAATVIAAGGSQGKRLAQLHDWLYGPQMPVVSLMPRTLATRRIGQHQSTLRLKGVEISLTADQALARAQEALAANSPGYDRFHSWYLLLEDKRIAPKWLVSQLTGLPAGAFTTHEALRTLAHLGIEVHRSELC